MCGVPTSFPFYSACAWASIVAISIFFLPIRNWTAGTATVIGVYVGAGLMNGYTTTIP
ncbi:MAG: hypothetical protein WA814_11345 [Candidatus Baltobacteraceae bacterium]